MKKSLRITALLLAVIFISLTLFSCSKVPNQNDEPSTRDELYDQESLYARALEFGYTGTLEDFITLMGDKIKKDGIEIKSSLIDNQGHLVFILNDGSTVDAGLINKNDGTASESKKEYEIEAYDGTSVSISFSHTMGEELRSVLNKYIKEFNKLYPNIRIYHTQVGGYNDVRDQINQQLASGNSPNIAYCYPDHVALYNLSGKVVPLDNFIESKIVVNEANGEILGLTDEQIAAFIDGYYAEGAVYDEAGTMYTLPMSKSAEVLYYNKTFFEENGLTVPTTWAELEEVSAQIKAIISDPDSKYYNTRSYPFSYDSESNWFITMCEQYGSPYTSLNNDEHFVFNNYTNQLFVKKLRTWYEKEYFTTQELYGAYTSGLFTNIDPTKGSCYMCIGSSAGAKNQVPRAVNGDYPFEVGIAPLPQVDVNNAKAISQGPSLCIFDSANKQAVAASWLFIKFLATNPEFQAEFSIKSGYIPVIEGDVLVEKVPSYGTWLETGIKLGDTVADEKSKVIANTIRVALEQSDAYFTPPAFNGSSKARDQVGELMKYCFTTPTNDVDALISKMFRDAVAVCVAG